MWHTAGEAMATLYRRCDLNTSDCSIKKSDLTQTGQFRSMRYKQYKPMVQILTHSIIMN